MGDHSSGVKGAAPPMGGAPAAAAVSRAEPGAGPFGPASCPYGACYGCLKTYRNQQYHEELSRRLACDLLRELAQHVVESNDIPPVVTERVEPLPEVESGAEQRFEALLNTHSFPLPPERQYRVDLRDGDTTVADFAYPAERILVYIDGMSVQIHGSAQHRLRDTVLRAKARMAGYQVLQTTAQALDDSTSAAALLNELAVFLGRSDLLVDHA